MKREFEECSTAQEFEECSSLRYPIHVGRREIMNTETGSLDFGPISSEHACVRATVWYGYGVVSDSSTWLRALEVRWSLGGCYTDEESEALPA